MSGLRSAAHNKKLSRPSVSKHKGRNFKNAREQSTAYLIGPPSRQETEEPLSSLVVVFSLEQTLGYYHEGKVIKRPNASKLLKLLKEKEVEIIVWSSAPQDNLNVLVKNLDPKGNLFDHVIGRNSSWYNEKIKNGLGSLKDLRRLDRPMEHIVMIDHAPGPVRCNPQHAILVEDFGGSSTEDATLEILTNVLIPLAECIQQRRCNVLEYLIACPTLHYRSFHPSTVYIPMINNQSGNRISDIDTLKNHTPPPLYQLNRPGALESFALRYIAPERDGDAPQAQYQKFGGICYKIQFQLV